MNTLAPTNGPARTTIILCVAVAILQLESRANENSVGESLWGKPIGGLSFGLKSEAGRRNFHPGELIRLTVDFKAERPICVPHAVLWQYSKLHVVGPDSRECIWDPGEIFKTDAPIRIEPDDWTKWDIDEQRAHTDELRLARGNRIWVDAKTMQRSPFSLVEDGKYRAWVECSIAAAGKAPKHAWQGTVKSNDVSWIITSLPDNKRRMELTSEQQRALAAWLAEVTTSAIDTSVREQAVNELRRQLILTENEGLAEKLAAITKARQADGLPLLMARSGSLRDGQVGIDGPYHKIMVDYILDSFETAAGKQGEKSKLPLVQQIDQVLLYLSRHRDDHVIHRRATAMLQQLSLQRVDLPIVPYAWCGLLALGELKPNLTTVEAERMIGPPVHKSADQLDWDCPLLPGHENEMPVRLSAWLKDGRVSRWEIQWPLGRPPYNVLQ